MVTCSCSIQPPAMCYTSSPDTLPILTVFNTVLTRICSLRARRRSAINACACGNNRPSAAVTMNVCCVLTTFMAYNCMAPCESTFISGDSHDRLVIHITDGGHIVHIRVHDLCRPAVDAHTLDAPTDFVMAVSNEGRLIVTMQRSQSSNTVSLRVWNCDGTHTL